MEVKDIKDIQHIPPPNNPEFLGEVRETATLLMEQLTSLPDGSALRAKLESHLGDLYSTAVEYCLLQVRPLTLIKK